VSFPSVSGQPDKAPHVKRCAAWLARHLRKIGLPEVKVIPTSGHPIVYAEWRGTGQVK
jgi:acetylornithine deacetylase/succinyl-diaminopimelate desuccinylase-like protein